ncbi:hypothetical protein [Nitrosopumilus sp. b1]|uniref:hypothetical protein n=1 Tax=Nitrosopumilus sp. b1 TaxID=2109907 RepID=UPI0015F4C433|nr:hypothetical protein [Nitrosopumilus sp. b1]
MIQKQLYINNNMRQLIKSCKLGRDWKKNRNFHSYKAVQDDAKILVQPMHDSETRELSFKKNSNVLIQDGLLRFHSKDIKNNF